MSSNGKRSLVWLCSMGKICGEETDVSLISSSVLIEANPNPVSLSEVRVRRRGSCPRHSGRLRLLTRQGMEAPLKSILFPLLYLHVLRHTLQNNPTTAIK